MLLENKTASSNLKLNWKEFVEQTLLNGTKYKGNKEKEKKIFSASMLGNTILQNYLKYKYGSPEQIQFGQNTAGSVFHVGAENIFLDKTNLPLDIDVIIEPDYKVILSNGWIISGKPDLVIPYFNIIVDWKNTTATIFEKLRLEGMNHQYALQLAVYQFLYYRLNNVLPKAALAVIDKSHSFYKATTTTNVLELKEIFTYDIDTIEEKLIETINTLQTFIDLDQFPEECTAQEKWFYKTKTITKPMRCIYYCDQNINCPYYSDFSTKRNLLDIL